MTEEQARDAHLREALRHAPDARVQPPAALSALILSEAHAKARDASTPVRPKPTGLRALWGWLARPAVATGFAGVMAATLVGMMWWDQPMDEAMPRRPVPATAAVPAAAPPPAVAMAPVQAPAAEAERAIAPPAAPPAALRKAAPAADTAALKADKKEYAAQAAKPAAAEQRANTPSAAREEAAAAAPTSPAPRPMPSVASADIASEGAGTVAAAGAAGNLAKSRSADEPKRQRALAPAPDATPNKASIPAPLDELRQSFAETAPTLAQLRSAIAAEPTRWAWQRDGAPPQAMNDAVSSWLAQLDVSAGDRWQPVDASMLRASREILLLRDGHLQHGFRLVESGVLWQRAHDRWQLVTLPPASLSVLEANAP